MSMKLMNTSIKWLYEIYLSDYMWLNSVLLEIFEYEVEIVVD